MPIFIPAEYFHLQRSYHSARIYDAQEFREKRRKPETKQKSENILMLL